MWIKKLQDVLKEKDIDLALIFSFGDKPNSNMVYFCNYFGVGVLAILKKKSVLIVPDMDYERALKTKLKVYRTDKKKKILETLVNLLKRNKIKKVGIEERNVSVYLYKKLRKALKARYSDLSDILSKIRMVKEKKELAYIKKACSVTDKVYSKIIKNFKFKTELELKDFIESEIKKLGCELAFDPIVASCGKSSLPHSLPSNRIKKGFLLLDFGAKYKRYCSDMSRMLYIGTPTIKELDNYNLVLDTLKKCESAKVKKFSQLYELAKDNLGERAEYFTHALGHGLGLDIHEPPSLFTEDKNKIQDNVVFTIEPGLYFPNKYGMRIEDTVVFQNKKIKVLTKSKKDLVTI